MFSSQSSLQAGAVSGYQVCHHEPDIPPQVPELLLPTPLVSVGSMVVNYHRITLSSKRVLKPFRMSPCPQLRFD